MKSWSIPGRASLLLFVVVAVCVSAISSCPAAERSPRYSVIPLGTPGAVEAWSPKFMYPQYINNRGDVVGIRGSGVVLYRDGIIYELGYPREPLSWGEVWGINDRGEILGLAFGASAVSFVLPSFPRPLPVAEARILPVWSFLPNDFNNYGTVIGSIYDREQDKDTPVVYRDGRITQLPPLVPGGYAFPYAINNRGQILGEATIPDDVERAYNAPGLRAVIWSGRRIINLGVLPGCIDSFGRDINDSGEAVGECISWEGYVGFIYRHGVMRPVPSPPGAWHTYATRINNAGHILIYAIPWRPNDEATLPPDSVLLYADGVLHDLIAIVARASRWRVQTLYATDMNDRGEIVGVAEYLDRDQRIVTQGILLVPDNNENRARISRSNDRLITPH